MIPSVVSILSSWGALSGHHLLLLASVASLGAAVFWQIAVNKPPRILPRSCCRAPGKGRRYRGDPINLKSALKVSD
jgi:hypothetical protein